MINKFEEETTSTVTQIDIEKYQQVGGTIWRSLIKIQTEI